MSLIVSEIYDALIEAGSTEEKARAAAAAIPVADQMATKEDITDVKAEMAEFKAEIRQDMADFKAEVRQDMAEFKAEVRQDIAAFKAEVRQDIADFKAEVNERFAKNRKANRRAQLRRLQLDSRCHGHAGHDGEADLLPVGPALFRPVRPERSEVCRAKSKDAISTPAPPPAAS